MKCEEFDSLKDKYLQGKTSQEQDKDIEAHLGKCSQCRNLLDSIIAARNDDKTFINKGWQNSVYTLDEKKQKKILMWAKYKNRFSIAAFILLLYLISMMTGTFLSSYYFTWGGENSRIYKTQRTAAILTEFSMPNVSLGISPRPFKWPVSGAGWGSSNLQIKPYFVSIGSYALQKEVGKETQTVGHLEINHLLSSINTRWNWQNGSYDQYLYFTYPKQGNIEYFSQLGQETWDALEILPEGTVAEMAISFNDKYSINQTIEKLAPYDLRITWYAVATGLEEKPASGKETNREPLTAFRGAWGFANLSQNILSQYNPISSGDSSMREEYFMNSMAFLLENEDLARKIYRGNPEELLLNERYQYLQKNGVKVYGMVVTGPSKELLKLKDLKEINSPALGVVKLWNWFNRSFKGTLY